MRIILSIIFLCISITALGQKKKSYEDQLIFQSTVSMQELVSNDLKLDETITPANLEKITDAEKAKREYAIQIKRAILDKVIANYNDLIANYPKSKLLFRALYNKGFAEFQNDYFESAKITFERILNSNANDFEKGGRGSGIMAEPYANYKNIAAENLTDIAILQQKYEEAIKYLDLTRKYPYHHFCGNAVEADKISTAIRYAKCYIGLNDEAKAVAYLLPNLIHNGLANNSEAVNLAYSLLIKKYSNEELKNKFETAFKNYTVGKRENGFLQFYIHFIDTEIPVEDWHLYATSDEKEIRTAMDKLMTETEFYKLISK